MRFAGEEAEFCLASTRLRLAGEAFRAAQEAARDRAYREMSPDQRSARISAIHDEIGLLSYRPLSVDIAARRSNLEAELKHLEKAEDEHRWAELARIEDEGHAKLNAIIAEGKADIDARIEAWLSMPVPGEQPAAQALFSDPVTLRAMERADV